MYISDRFHQAASNLQLECSKEKNKGSVIPFQPVSAEREIKVTIPRAQHRQGRQKNTIIVIIISKLMQ